MAKSSKSSHVSLYMFKHVLTYLFIAPEMYRELRTRTGSFEHVLGASNVFYAFFDSPLRDEKWSNFQCLGE